MRHRHAALTLAAALALALAAGGAAGQNGQGIVIRALDEPVKKLNLADKPILDALRQLTQETGLRIDLTEEALEGLPQAEQTRLNLNIANVSLRDALTGILAPMGLQWHVADTGVVVTPSPALGRMCRRPTFTESRIIAALSTLRLEKGKPFLAQLLSAAGMPELTIVWDRSISPEAQAKAFAAADSRLPCSAGQYLDTLGQEPGWTWYLWGTDLIILPLEAQAQRQLMRRTTVRFQAQPLVDVLIDLARRARLKLNLDPGVLNFLPAQIRDSFTFLITDATVEQALQAISGATGLQFKTEKLGLRVSASPALLATTMPTTRPRSSFILMVPIQVPQGQGYITVRPDELPPEFVKTVEQFKLDEINRIRKQFGYEPLKILPLPPPAGSPTPSTAPAAEARR